MGVTTENIKEIIAAAHPNGNLMHKANERLDIQAQIAREQTLYSRMVNPLTHQPIHDIKELNEAILDMDKIYKLGALLPHGSINGGEVERLLSNPPYGNGNGYNLKLRGHNKFTEKEQVDIKAHFQDLANLAMDRLKADPKLSEELYKASAQQALDMAFLAMSTLNINNKSGGGTVTIFGSKSWFKQDTKGVVARLLDSSTPLKLFELKSTRIIEKMRGSGRTKNERGEVGGMMEGIQYKKDNGAEIIFNPNLNNLSTDAFNSLYAYAAEHKLLENDLQLEGKNSLGSGDTSPMDVSAAKWKADVFDAMRRALSEGELKNLIPNMDFNNILDDLLGQYDVYNNIALGRSISNLRGFTGELRAIIIAHLLFPNDTAALLGKAKVQLENSFRREDAPIDVAIQIFKTVYGIQVKNVSELESYSWGNFRNSDGMTIPNFYIERLQESLDDEEKKFFGAYVYNQPVSDYPNPYEEIYAGFQPAFENEFVPVYKKLALYIIRQITKIQGTNNPILAGNTTLTNDLFFMNNKIVPASAFLMAMQGDKEDLITSSFTLRKAPYPGYYRSGAKQPADYGSYTDQATISYEIDVQYSRLLTSAYNAS